MKRNASTIQTMRLLHNVAAHLSGRDEFKNIIYQVQISPNMTIHVDPDVYVYPSKHKRKPGDREALLHHIAIYHMDDVLRVNNGVVIAAVDSLVPGIYVYGFSFLRRRRKWMKM